MFKLSLLKKNISRFSNKKIKLFQRYFRSDQVGISGFNRFNLSNDKFYEGRAEEYIKPKKPSVIVSLTGAAGNIGYATIFRLASGDMLGPDQPIYINAIELPHALNRLKGIKMELEDCAFPVLKGVTITDNLDKGFENADYALLIGSKPRVKGQERKDLLRDNGLIFKKIGKSLNKFAKSGVKVVVVGNPSNTNCMICSNHAPDIDPKNFTSMMRLDHDRALHLGATTLGQEPQFITEFCVWGNHSKTMFPDLTYSNIYGEPYRHTFGNMEFDSWNREKFIPIIQTRGEKIINVLGSSSAASAGNACLNHMCDWVNGNDGRWVSMGVVSDGSYGIDRGLWSGVPLEVNGSGEYKLVKDLPLSTFQEEMINKSVKELKSERDDVADLIA